MKIIVHGATGRMGCAVLELVEKSGGKYSLAAGISRGYMEDAEPDCYTAIDRFPGEADCVVDFSNHIATKPLLDYCVAKNMPVVIATTGQTADEKEMIAAAAEKIPVFYSANMSLGIAVLSDIAQRAAAMFPDADIEIVESHHNQKLDVPSGTALLLADAICQTRPEAELNIGRHENGKRRKEEIGIHSLRIGSEVGMHEILISTGTQTLTLKHQAHSRALFAEGALAAADFLVGKGAGYYTMKDLIKG